MKVTDELRRTKQAVEKRFLGKPGVTGVDIGYKEVGGRPTETLAVRVLVARKRLVPEDQAVPKELDGVPMDVIQRRYVLHSSSVSDHERVAVDTPAPAASRRHDPVLGGISIGTRRAVDGQAVVGTLGAIVEDVDTGRPLLLSAFHVLAADDHWTAGDVIVQPSVGDGGIQSRAGTLVRSSLGDEVDCAVADTTRGVVGRVLEISRIAGFAVPADGQRVRKYGRTSGLTYGVIETVELTVQIRYAGGLGMVTLTNQINVKPDTARNARFGDPGDSGSVLVDDDNRIVGLYVAGDPETGDAMANPIPAVLSALKVRVLVGRPGTGGPPGPIPPAQPAPCAPCPPFLLPSPCPPCLPAPCAPCAPFLLPPPCLSPPCSPPPPWGPPPPCVPPCPPPCF